MQVCNRDSCHQSPDTNSKWKASPLAAYLPTFSNFSEMRIGSHAKERAVLKVPYDVYLEDSSCYGGVFSLCLLLFSKLHRIVFRMPPGRNVFPGPVYSTTYTAVLSVYIIMGIRFGCIALLEYTRETIGSYLSSEDTLEGSVLLSVARGRRSLGLGEIRMIKHQ